MIFIVVEEFRTHVVATAVCATGRGVLTLTCCTISLVAHRTVGSCVRTRLAQAV